MRLAVVLQKAVELKIGREVEAEARADQVLGKIAFRKTPNVALAGKLHDEKRRWLPRRSRFDLIEFSIVEITEPPCQLSAEFSFRSQPTLESVSLPVVFPDWNCDSI